MGTIPAPKTLMSQQKENRKELSSRKGGTEAPCKAPKEPCCLMRTDTLAFKPKCILTKVDTNQL